VGATHSPGSELGVLLEPIEQRVIRTLGVELAQARVDIAFLTARLTSIKEMVNHEWELGETAARPEFVLMLQSLLA
jgi:hypothetical protein